MLCSVIEEHDEVEVGVEDVVDDSSSSSGSSSGSPGSPQPVPSHASSKAPSPKNFSTQAARACCKSSKFFETLHVAAYEIRARHVDHLLFVRCCRFWVRVRVRGETVMDGIIPSNVAESELLLTSQSALAMLLIVSTFSVGTALEYRAKARAIDFWTTLSLRRYGCIGW